MRKKIRQNRKLTSTVAIAFALICANTISADSGSGNGNGPVGTIIPTAPPKQQKGHRDVPSPTPTCYISGGVLYVVSPDDWSYATVTLVEASTGIQSVNAGFFDEGIEVYIPSTTGNFTFTIVTESGDEFIGSFTL